MSRRRRWLAIVNPSAGAMRRRAFSDFWMRRLRYAAAKVAVCEGVGDAASIMADERDFDGIAVVGGDGTVFDMLPALDAGQCLTVFPAGRGNSLARSLGLDGMAKALTALWDGVEQPMDLLLLGIKRANGAIEQRVCASTVALGYDASVVARAVDFPQAGRHGYALAGLLTAPQKLAMQLGYDGEALQSRTLTGLVISNISHVGPYCRFPQARLDDGLLHVLELDVPRLRQVAGNLAALAGANPAGPSRSGRHLQVQLQAPGPLMADGEILEDVVEFSVNCVPGAIHCNRPA
jgi:diacylglycerol kinase family enzyme